MSGRHSRSKGHAWEREIAQAMTEARGVKYGTARSLARYRDDEGVDVLSLADAVVIQAKVGLEPPVRRALEQVVAGAREGEVPVAAIRWNQKEGRKKLDAAIMPWKTFLQLVTRHREEEAGE